MAELVTWLIQFGMQQGIWAALYIYLFLRMLKENTLREKRYNELITRLSWRINGPPEIAQEQHDQTDESLNGAAD